MRFARLARTSHFVLRIWIALLASLAALTCALPARAGAEATEMPASASGASRASRAPRDFELEVRFAPPLGSTGANGLHVIGASLGARFLDLFLIEGGANVVLPYGSKFRSEGEGFLRAGLSLPLGGESALDRGWSYRLPILATYARASRDQCNRGDPDACGTVGVSYFGAMAGLDFVHWRGKVGFSMRVLAGFERELGSHLEIVPGGTPISDTAFAASASLGVAFR
jgi:hypothetical protein